MTTTSTSGHGRTRRPRGIAEVPAQKRTRAPFFWATLGLALFVATLYAAAGIILVRHGGKEPDWGWTSGYARGFVEVTTVNPAGPAAGLLEPGDRVLSIAGESRLSLTTLPIVLRRVAALGGYPMVVERSGQQHELELPPPQVVRRWRWTGLGSRLVVSLSCFALAVLVGLADPFSAAARRLSLASFAAAPFFLWNALLQLAPFLDGWERWALNAMLLLHPLHLAFGVHFFATFPEGRTGAQWVRLTTVAVYVGAFAIVLARPFRWALERSSGQEVGTEAQALLWHLHDRLFLLWIMFALLAIPVVIIRNFVRVRDVGLRRRLRWVVFGVAAGLLPFFVTEVVLLFAPASRAADLATEAAFLAVALLPASLAYAVLKHRVMGIRVVVRRGVQYLLARNSLRVALALPSMILLYRLVALRHRTVAEVLFARPEVVAAMVIAGLSLRYRQPLLGWIDRRFFRQSYVQEQLLLRLIDEVRRQPTLDGVARLLTEQLEGALHPTSVTVLLSREVRGDLETAYSSTGAAEQTPITRGRPLLRHLEGSLEPREVDERLHHQIGPEESAWLEQHRVALLVPLAGSEGELVGLLALGEKRSEEPYSPADRRLLQALGGQAAITVENLLLRDRVTREAGIRRDVLERLEGDRLPLLRECPRCGTCSDADGECETDGVELVLTLPIERVLDQRYRLDRRIGQGGMASVFQAWDLRLSRRVAAKILMGRYFGDPVVLRRFAREARSVAALSHPNVVSVYDSGTCGPDGAYLILELVEGQTMRELIRSAAPLSPASAADLLEPLLCGLEAAHRAGLVHRDIKPSNVFIGGTAADPIVKLGDFGIAKRHFEDEEPGTVLTETGALVGTVRYMAPEQLAGLEVDQRADLWAIGLITVELLTGRHPFSGREPAQILAAICGPPIRLEAQGSSARDLETILQRCLTRRPEDRLATAAALRGVLVPALRACGGPVTMVEVPVGSKRTDEPSTLSG